MSISSKGKRKFMGKREEKSEGKRVKILVVIGCVGDPGLNKAGDARTCLRLVVETKI